MLLLFPPVWYSMRFVGCHWENCSKTFVVFCVRFLFLRISLFLREVFNDVNNLDENISSGEAFIQINEYITDPRLHFKILAAWKIWFYSPYKFDSQVDPNSTQEYIYSSKLISWQSLYRIELNIFLKGVWMTHKYNYFIILMRESIYSFIYYLIITKVISLYQLNRYF